MIYGKRIRLRHAERSDIPVFVKWLNDPEVRAGISAYLPMSMAEEEKWFEKSLDRPPEEGIFCIEVRQTSKWAFIGSTSFFNFNWRARKAEIGIMIGDKSFWDKGYGTETMLLMLQHGFETLNLHRIYLKVFATNPRAIRAYEKVGFLLEARLREGNYDDGVYSDDLIMGVLQHEWDIKTKSVRRPR
ncbi:MAG: GNAT family protein [Anaerolineales bacterium]